MMVTTWTMIKQFQNSSRSPRIAQEPPLQIRLLFQEQYPHQQSCRQTTIHCTVQNTMQNYYLEKQGDKTLFINSDQLLFTLQYPSRIIEVTITFG